MRWERRFVTCPTSDNLAKHNVFFCCTFSIGIDITKDYIPVRPAASYILQLYLFSLSVIFHTLACLHRLIARSTIGIHQYDMETAMLEHSLIAALA